MSSKKKRPIKAVDSKPPTVQPTGDTESNHGADVANSEMIEQFERELNWCVEQVVMGLETQKADSRQAQEAQKILKILVSSKAPVIKKRQVMRTKFGDYRKKMQDQDKKSAAAAKKIKLSAVSTSASQQSVFLKKSISKASDQSNMANSPLTDQSGDNNSGPSNKSEASLSADFKFNFTLNDTPEVDAGNCCDAGNDNLTTQPGVSDTNGDLSETKGLFVKSDNSFQFNFPVPEEA